MVSKSAHTKPYNLRNSKKDDKEEIKKKLKKNDDDKAEEKDEEKDEDSDNSEDIEDSDNSDDSDDSSYETVTDSDDEESDDESEDEEIDDEDSEDDRRNKKRKITEKKSTKKEKSQSKEKKTKQQKKETNERKEKNLHKKNKNFLIDESGDDDDDDCIDDDASGNKKLDIVFTIDPFMDDDDVNEDMIEKNEDEYNSEDDEKVFMKENYIQIEDIDNTEEETKKNKKSKKNTKQKKEKNPELLDIEKEYIELIDLKKQLTEKLIQKPKNKIIKNAINDCNRTIKKLIKNARKQNTKSYKELVIGKPDQLSEIDFFKKNLSNKEQQIVMKDFREINKSINIEIPYRLLILQSSMPTPFKTIAIQKLNFLKSMQPGDSEYHKVKYWVDNFMKIPFGVNKSLSVNLKEDGIDKCNEFLTNAKETLDKCVYGLENAKLQIMQLLGQWITNPTSVGTAIAIKGPPGSGKTMLIKEGISKILGREFAFITLGGAADGSYLEGHSYTYEGSSWGKIVQILKETKCMNPVIYFDELDKVSDTPRGQEIIGILTHLTDTTQNDKFHDKYFSEIDFDLSKCLFIFSYNDENLVNPILKDRMYRIQTKEYDTKEKIIIAKNFLIPKIRDQVCFSEEDVLIPDDTLHFIISNQNMTKNEKGVRNLKRCLEIIFTKLNLYRLIKPENNGLLLEMNSTKVSFPITVLKTHVESFIKNEETQNHSLFSMYV